MDINIKAKGFYTAEVEYRNGKKEILFEDSANVIVNNFLKCVAANMKNESGYQGITKWAIGDNGTAATKNDTGLYGKFFEKAITIIEYLDTKYNPTSFITNIIRSTVVIDYHEGIGKHREYGIFGGKPGEDYLLSRKTFEEINKTNDMKLTLSARFEFSLA